MAKATSAFAILQALEVQLRYRLACSCCAPPPSCIDGVQEHIQLVMEVARFWQVRKLNHSLQANWSNLAY